MRSPNGFSLVETVISLGVLTAGLLGAAAVLAQGMQKMTSSPGDVVTTQKAAEAIETVFAARDSHTLTWAQIRNVHGYSGSDNGIFLDGPQSLRLPGADGVVNTTDDGDVETVTYPGPDQMIGTADDTTRVLDKYTREITIRDVPNENGALRSITVTVTYQTGAVLKTYTLTTYISNFA